MKPSSPHDGKETEREIKRTQSNQLPPYQWGEREPNESIISTLLGREGEPHQTDILCTTMVGRGRTQRAHHLHNSGERERAHSNRPPPYQWGERETNEPIISTLLGGEGEPNQTNHLCTTMGGGGEPNEPITSIPVGRERIQRTHHLQDIGGERERPNQTNHLHASGEERETNEPIISTLWERDR